uniref:Putative methyltransferase PMT15 n=1 Tax=Talaromyces marneffei PM1 TaxID=1077442 RepID=A0A093UZR7_TALMA
MRKLKVIVDLTLFRNVLVQAKGIFKERAEGLRFVSRIDAVRITVDSMIDRSKAESSYIDNDKWDKRISEKKITRYREFDGFLAQQGRWKWCLNVTNDIGNIVSLLLEDCKDIRTHVPASLETGILTLDLGGGTGAFGSSIYVVGI